jgi:FixJ family two-component response regulator
VTFSDDEAMERCALPLERKDARWTKGTSHMSHHEGAQRAPMAEPTGTVLVVDDDISVRESLKHLLRSAGWHVEAFATARDFLAHPKVETPSCVVLDIELPDLNGLDLQRQLIASQVTTPIIFITGYGDIPKTVQAMKAGAVEFLAKPVSGEALLSAVENAIDLSHKTRVRRQELLDLKTRLESLTPRERQVMELVVSGLLNKQVGAELGMREVTVKGHRGQVMRKMNANSFADLVTMAAALGVRVGSR